jgi:protein tyrosine phosphatase
MASEIPLEHRMEFSQIESQIYIGTNACCVTHFKEELLAKGITCDISLEGEMLDQPFGVDCYVWLPTPDHTPPSMHSILIGCAALEEMLREGRNVYIHCKNGHGRAPAFYTAFLILKRGYTLDQAWNIVKTSRPEAHLDASQLAFLRSLTKGVKS